MNVTKDKIQLTKFIITTKKMNAIINATNIFHLRDVDEAKNVLQVRNSLINVGH